MAWLFVPESEGSSAAPGSLSVRRSLWLVGSSGTPLQRPLSWRGWRARDWIRRLSGMTSRPSRLAASVDAWTSSLRATRASRSASPAEGVENAIRDTCGPTWRALFAPPIPQLSFWKTSPAICGSAHAKSSESFTIWATALRRHCLQRRKSEQATSGSASSSWASPAAWDQKGSTGGGMARSLRTDTRNWATPMGMDGVKPSAGNHREADLTHQSQTWPTPRASSNENRTTKPPPSTLTGKHGRLLAGEAAMWQTPSVVDITGGHTSRSGDRKGEPMLGGQARNWKTPMAGDMRGRAYQRDRGMKGRERPTLVGEARSWATPKSRDWKGGQGQTERHSPDPDKEAVSFLPSPPAPATPGGPESSKHTPGSPPPSRSRKRLNPFFVEWLMGFPPGWSIPTHGAPTASGASETPSSPNRRPAPSSCCGGN